MVKSVATSRDIVASPVENKDPKVRLLASRFVTLLAAITALLIVASLVIKFGLVNEPVNEILSQ